MEFTYSAYKRMLQMLRDCGYAFSDYRNYAANGRAVILRHDIDMTPAEAVKMATLENSLGANAVYFVLTTSDLYNAFSAKNISRLKELLRLGHEVGLHFDETVCDADCENADHASNMIQAIKLEAGRLSEAIGTEVTSVSMHRPSKLTLESDLRIPGIINSYGIEFFKGFKYVSDSRMRWREDVEEVIRSGRYERLHILTHAFWYHDEARPAKEILKEFAKNAAMERYEILSKNIADMNSILRADELQE